MILAGIASGELATPLFCRLSFDRRAVAPFLPLRHLLEQLAGLDLGAHADLTASRSIHDSW